MKHTALYLRVSTEAQADEGYSLAAQAEKLEAYCRMKGISQFRRYVDGGFSGSNLSRPAVGELIEAIRSGAVERVVVYKLDRLSRSQKDTLYLIEDVFLPHGVDFVSINENIDTGSPYGRAMIGILSAFAQLERENIFLRTRMGMVERSSRACGRAGARSRLATITMRRRASWCPIRTRTPCARSTRAIWPDSPPGASRASSACDTSIWCVRFCSARATRV